MDSDGSIDDDYEGGQSKIEKLKEASKSSIDSSSSDSESGSESEHSKSSPLAGKKNYDDDDDGEISDSSKGEENDEKIVPAVVNEKRKRRSPLPRVLRVEQFDDGEVLNYEAGEGDIESDPKADFEKEKNASPDKRSKKDHAEDLSDVSDLDSIDGKTSLSAMSDIERKAMKMSGLGSRIEPPIEEMEQLDFEADEQQDREEGECDDKKEEKSDDDGELKGDDLEEGELSDEEENRPEETEPRPVCRFYSRGACTWGANCRFLHPGVTDKGNYTMFDMIRPMVPLNGPQVYAHSIDYRAMYEKTVPMQVFPAVRKEEPTVYESAWERGLRQAKEMMRKSTKRKETDMDFEEKKMNLSLGQDELDKENDYYTRPASPVFKEDSERWGLKTAPLDVIDKHYDDLQDSPYYPTHHNSGNGEFWRRIQYEPDQNRIARGEKEFRRGTKYRRDSQEYYEKGYAEKKAKKNHTVREVIVQRPEKAWREDRYGTSPPAHRKRGDEWADPWMRSNKSPPGTRKIGRSRRRRSYSTGSSYSSSSTSRSTSRSSYSSYDSRSRSHSKSRSKSRSRSSSPKLTQVRRKTNRPLGGLTFSSPGLITKQSTLDQKLFPKAKPLNPNIITEKKLANERALLMNPPAPSPRKQKTDLRPPSPAMLRKSAQNPPAPTTVRPPRPVNAERSKTVLAAAMAAKKNKSSRSRSSRSSSGTESSGSSTESSESTFTSSSSSHHSPKPQIRQTKKIVLDERERLEVAQSMKVKAIDALKLSSGQKPQIKLTLKTPGTTAATSKRTITNLPDFPELSAIHRAAERPAGPLALGKKRPAEDADANGQQSPAKIPAIMKPAVAKKAPSRREELLKQLKAVEDAIARKRSKV